MLITDILNEDVFGRLAAVYHRTHTHENVQAIRLDGFHAGPRAMYGQGIYTTYSLFSQLSPYMLEQYGEYVIKSRINLNGFLILEPDVAKKVYGKNWTIEQQANQLFQTGRHANYDTFTAMQERIEEGEPSSKFAWDIVEKGLVQRMRGIVYRGRADGRCAVVYQPDTILPISWTKITLDDVQQIRAEKMVGVAEKEFIKGLVWEKISNRELIARSLKPNAARDLVTHPETIKSIAHPTPEQQLAAVTADPTVIQYIKDPTPEAQVTATHGDPRTIKFIVDPVPEAIIWPLKILGNQEMPKWKPETINAALRSDCTILPTISFMNDNKKPTPEQWASAWMSPNANEMIQMYLEQYDGSFDATTIPHDAMLHVMQTFPWILRYFRNVSPDLVAVAVLSPKASSMGHNTALGNCTLDNVQVDTSAIDPDTLTAIVRQTPNAIFAIADPSIPLVKVAMQASRSTAQDLGRRYHLPPELQELVPKGLTFR